MEECPANAESFTIVCFIMPLEFIKSISVYSYSFYQTNPPLIITMFVAVRSTGLVWTAFSIIIRCLHGYLVIT